MRQQGHGTAAARSSSPHLPTHVVRRERLARRIGAEGARLVVVTGPAGSGKTVAVRDWASTSPGPVTWLSLDSRHADPEYFLDALLLALEDLAPGVLEAAFDTRPDDQLADQAAQRVADHLARGPQATVVLDDVHVIDRSPTAALLGRLVPVISDTRLRVVICSRSDPPLALHGLRLAGELVELREADLRFSCAEAVAFFARFPQVDVGGSQIERLAERTEGWAAGLQFAALSLAGHDDPDAFVERFTGSDRHVADFLLDEVLLRQPEDVREFLLVTSLLERLRADLCAQVTGRDDAGELLRRVEAENLFVVPLDDERQWFRYHHLFGELLRREVRTTRPDLERRGHQRAARWFAAHGHPSRAITHHLEAGELDEAFDLVTTQLGEQLLAGRSETVRSWLARLPDEFVDATVEHQLLLTLAHARSGAIHVAERVMQRARERATPQVLAEVGLHYDVTDAAIAAVVGDPQLAIELGLAAWDRRDEVVLSELPEGLAVAARELWGVLPAALARAYALLDERAGVRRWITVMRRQGPRLPSDLVAALGSEAWAEARRGRLRVAHELAGEALALGTEQGRGSRRSMIGARVAMAYIHREGDRLDAAVDVLAPHLEEALREGQVAITTLGEVELALVDSARGDDGEAVARILHVRRERAGRGLPPWLAGVLDAAECRLRLYAGDLDRAGDLLDEIAPGPERRLLAERREVGAGRPAGVVERLADLREADADRRRRFEAVALSARAAVDAGDPVTARRLIGAIAPLAVRERALRTFLCEGFAVDDPALVAPPRHGGPAAGRSTLVEPLSERELSVLRFLPTRMSNREIGAELFVSLNTVKSHLKAIYRKLDVEGRDDAVRRARQLGLLS